MCLRINKALHHFGRGAEPATALGMPLRQSFVHGCHKIFVLQHLVGVLHRFIQHSRRSFTSSAISPSPKLSCARRISITRLPPGLERAAIRTQQIMVEFADRLHLRFEFLVIVQPTAHLGNLLAAQAELAGRPLG
jgi:hypothetical protein